MTVVLFAAAVVLITAGMALLFVDRRRRTQASKTGPEPPPEPPSEPGSLFRDTYDDSR